MNFEENLCKVFPKTHKAIGIIRPYLDIIYYQAFNESFHKKVESLRNNAGLAMTGAMRGSSTEKIYQELGFESLKPYLGIGIENFVFSIKLLNKRPLPVFLI